MPSDFKARLVKYNSDPDGRKPGYQEGSRVYRKHILALKDEVWHNLLRYEKKEDVDTMTVKAWQDIHMKFK